MIRWRRAAAWLGVVAQLVGVHSLGAQTRLESITLAISGIQANSIPPAPNILVNGLNPQPGLTYSITLELSREPAFARPFSVQSATGLSASFHLDSLLTQDSTVYFRARLTDQFGVTAAQDVQTHAIQRWLRLDTPAQLPLVILNTRRPLFAWSSPAITLLWQYDLTIVNTATGAEQASYQGLSDTSFVIPDSLESNTSYSWRVTSHAGTGSTKVTVKSAGTFVITSSTQPTVTLFYQNFPDPFGRGQRSDQTCFWFDLDRAATVRLMIFDIRLRRVRQIVPGPIGNGALGAGSYGRQDVDAKSGCDPRLTWDGRDDHGRFVPPGIYVAQFIANGKSTTIKMMYKGPP
jgi:hypothetical protein